MADAVPTNAFQSDVGTLQSDLRASGCSNGWFGIAAPVAAAMPPIRVLNVAEKPSVAKEVSRVLNGGQLPPSRRGPSPYNAIWEFPYTVENKPCVMVFTSVTGHLMEVDFEPKHKSWHACNPGFLIEGAPVIKQVARDKGPVAENLVKEAKRCAWLILWLDCDREGENIAFEVLDVCRQAKPNIVVKRAQFSALSWNDVTRALTTLRAPNENEAKAVDMRQEIDLRIGASFTRFTTMLLQNSVALPGGTVDRQPVVSYGPCQFPTLGFIVQRKWDIDAHVPERFWKIVLKHAPGSANANANANANADGDETRSRHGQNNNSNHDGSFAEFLWSRDRLFDQDLSGLLFRAVSSAAFATVVDESGRPTNRAQPLPLNTLEMQKRLNRVIRVSPNEIMNLAEELYQQGFISYPRTETDSFQTDFDFKTTIDALAGHPQFGFHAQALSNGRFHRPRAGSNNDNAHPPIYPTKLASGNDYETFRRKNANLVKVYEFVARHFLACCSAPAVAHKTTVRMLMGGEAFTATGLMIKEMNYLDVYGKGPVGGPRLDPSYDSWSNNTLPTYHVGQQFTPTTLRLDQSQTAAPALLSEVDLLQKMENHQIGTDATQAAHIEKIVGERGYAVKVGENRLKPTELGEGLVAGYSRAGLDHLWLPTKRAETEADVSKVAAGRLAVDVAKKNTTAPMLLAFRELERNKATLVQAVREFLPGGAHGDGGPGDDGGGGGGLGDTLGIVRRCGACGDHVELFCRAGAGDSSSFDIACAGVVRGCSSRLRLPDAVVEAAVDAMRDCGNDACADRNGQRAHVVELRMRARRLPPRWADMQQWSGCVFCDKRLQELIQFLGDAPRETVGGGGGGEGAVRPGTRRGRAGAIAAPIAGGARRTRVTRARGRRRRHPRTKRSRARRSRRSRRGRFRSWCGFRPGHGCFRSWTRRSRGWWGRAR